MPAYCCVPECRSDATHHFPKDLELHKKWVAAINRSASANPRSTKLWLPKGKNARVCRQHFMDADYLPPGLCGERRLLKKDAVPSIFAWKKIPKKDRKERLTNRLLRNSSKSLASKETSTVSAGTEFIQDFVECEVSMCEVSVGNNCYAMQTATNDVETQCMQPQTENWTQCTILSDRWSLDKLWMKGPTVFKMFTGFQNCYHFHLIFNIMWRAISNVYENSQLPPVSEMLLTVLKLRRNMPDAELAAHFEISRTTAGRIFVKWLNYMYVIFKKLNFFPDIKVILQHAPHSFKSTFPKVVMIIDGTECPIEQPKAPILQQGTFSSYKHRNTMKVVVGIAPSGLIMHVSDAYGGRSSDREITERSELKSTEKLKQLSGHEILCDKGFPIQDLFAPYDITITTPAFLKNHNQLSRLECIVSRKISGKRIHVERIIGLCKSYKILKATIKWERVGLFGRMFYVCASLCNFRNPIVNKNA